MSFTANGASTFVSEMLTLEHACDVEHGGALIVVDDSFTAPLNARGLQVHACDSSSLTVLSDHVRLSQCSDGGLCGDAATCADVAPLPSAPNLTSVDCSCTGEFFPSPKSASLALAPYGFDPSVDYCVTPRVLQEIELSGFVLEETLRLSKTGSANTEHILDLTMHIGGTDVASADWTIIFEDFFAILGSRGGILQVYLGILEAPGRPKKHIRVPKSIFKRRLYARTVA